MIDQKFKSLSFSHPIILYDGDCMLCNRVIGYLIDKDTEERLRYCALQTAYPTNGDYDTVQLLWQGVKYEKAAVIEELSKHIRLTRMTGLLRYVPSAIKNLVYDLIAKIRYRIFGRSKECMVILQDKAHLFLTKP